MDVPWELFFVDDLVIFATSLKECIECVKTWNEDLESMGLHLNMNKRMVMASGLGLDDLRDSGKHMWTECCFRVGCSFILCLNTTFRSTGNVQVSKLSLSTRHRSANIVVMSRVPIQSMAVLSNR